MPYTLNPFTGKLDYYSTGGTGPTGPAGAPGANGMMGLDGDDGQDGMTVIGPQGNQGVQGQVGVAVFVMDGENGEDGYPIPGPQGIQGIQGIPGVTTNTTSFIYLDADVPDEPLIIQGPAGKTGTNGTNGTIGYNGAPGMDGLDADEPILIPGPQGPQGPAGTNGIIGINGATGPIGNDGIDGEDAWFGPQGNQGIQGVQGAPGVQGQVGVAVFVMDGENGEDGYPIPGSTYTAGLLGISAGLTANTTINDTVTYTTGGVTLPGQVANAGYIWRVRARGTFVAVSSATARNAQIAPYWGSTALPAITVAVLVSVAQTTNWFADFEIVASSTTAVWAGGFIQNKIDYPAIVAGTTSPDKTDMATPASTTVTAGAQTIDLRFSMSVAVATDQWVVHSVTIERIR